MKLELTKSQVLDFLKTGKLMSLATYGDFPWIASVYYSFDDNLNIYFLSSPATLHCRQIAKNPQVAVSIADSHQSVAVKKRGLQLWGKAGQISSAAKIKHALSLWKDFLEIKNADLSYENMLKRVVTGRMYKIVPRRIKLFDQDLFDVEDGAEPVMEL
jgi:uncharacterized protein YhbP (UPF0306 family)